jgi:maltose O-acetyltransferase
MRLLAIDGLMLKSISLGKNNHFAVPIRSGGRGVLIIGDRNSFVFRMAPMLGNGGILLQPRAQNSVLKIGSNCSFSNNIAIVANDSIEIGDNCLIGNSVQIVDSDFHGLSVSERGRLGLVKPTRIGSNVWIGTGVIVLKGVTIGDNSIVGAMSLVTRDVPKDSIVGGNPARWIREVPR